MTLTPDDNLEETARQRTRDQVDLIRQVHQNRIIVDSDDDADFTFMCSSDELLVTISRRLKETLPAGVLCGRVAGDKFAVLMTAGQNVENIIRAAIDAVARPYWADTVVRVTAHAGFAQAPRHAATRGELTRRADLALRAAAKRGPGAIVAFDVAIDTVSTDQKFIHRELPRAISARSEEHTSELQSR